MQRPRPRRKRMKNVALILPNSLLLLPIPTMHHPTQILLFRKFYSRAHQLRAGNSNCLFHSRTCLAIDCLLGKRLPSRARKGSLTEVKRRWEDCTSG
ncbi:hypothetical protein QBC38DRAFT_474729 [Podospora fimiseda]|uniref:Secreted protein n=1 Tax=Podospora fimiseda TaxID=252190 RepID=A0AAN7BS99_9PEZI|nr:hypothetical protein QBC38DRAFT_474729 [Podospora fimiseda]